MRYACSYDEGDGILLAIATAVALTLARVKLRIRLLGEGLVEYAPRLDIRFVRKAPSLCDLPILLSSKK